MIRLNTLRQAQCDMLSYQYNLEATGEIKFVTRQDKCKRLNKTDYILIDWHPISISAVFVSSYWQPQNCHTERVEA